MWTALIEATLKAQADVFKLLLEFGAKVDVVAPQQDVVTMVNKSKGAAARQMHAALVSLAERSPRRPDWADLLKLQRNART